VIDLISLLNEQNVPYSDHGDYVKIKCLNPAHEDKNPSMTILKKSGFAKCWSCGTTYTYGQLVYRLTGQSPLKNFEDKQNFRFERTLKDSVINSKTNFEPKERKLKIRGELKNPLQNREVLHYLRSISIDKDIIKNFNISYMLKGYMSFNGSDKMTFISNRICIPLYENGKLINYECRDYTGKQQPKVLYPRGGKSDILFNYDNLNLNEPLYIVEGIKSALRIYKFGYTNVTATLGASIGKGQIGLISKMAYPIAFPDNDEAGERMLSQIEKSTQNNLYVTFMNQKGYDPADGEEEELLQALSSYVPVAEYYIKKYPVFREPVEWEEKLLPEEEKELSKLDKLQAEKELSYY